MLATLVCLAMPPEEFDEVKSVASFEDFAEFLEQLRPLLPDLPMLEDFVPEADWGDVRVSGATGFEPIFYGGSVERMPDFIEAFRLLAADQPRALADMNLAIAVQRHLVEAVTSEIVGSTDLVDPGHMEVPSAAFWAACRQALLSAYAAVHPLIAGTSNELIAEQGALRVPDSMSALADMVMTEAALPLFFVRASDQVLPVAPRGATSAVLDLWSARVQVKDVEALAAFGTRLGRYLSRRFRRHDVVTGPIHVVGDSGRFDPRLAGILRAGNRFHLVLPLDEGDVPRLGQIERQLMGVVDGSKRWGLALEDGRQILEFRNAAGEPVRSNSIDLIAVLPHASTQPRVLRLPKCNSRVIGLPDFVSLFDSLDDGSELEKFWEYLDRTASFTGGFAGLVDHFAAFRDSHALLVPGAIAPSFISLDPHWNSGWRFKELKEFWDKAPSTFPDDQCTWKIERVESGMTRLKAKGPLMLAWSGAVGTCTVQATMEIGDSDPDFENGPLLELFVQCVVDALTHRGSLLVGLPPFQRPQVVLRCELGQRLLPARDDEAETARRAAQSLLDAWTLIGEDGDAKLEAAVQVNISRLRSRLEGAKDASFEAECAAAVATGLCALVGTPCDEDVLRRLGDTASDRPRFTVRSMRRTVDVPDHASPSLPKPEQFKLARKELAEIFKDLGVAVPARYELEQAKQIMNAARDAMRLRLHERIASYNRAQLLRTCVQQHDELTSQYQHEVTRLQLSLSHDVSFDRASRFAKLHEENTGMARNYRYLLECCLSLQGQGTAQPAIEDVVQLIASVDWLSVLYGASDTLHNNIDVGGIELDDSFVPTVFFSDDWDAKEKQYLRHVANVKLGVGLQEEDEVNSEHNAERNWERLNAALVADLGCALTQLTQVLEVLARWHTAGGADELRFRYQAAPSDIADKVLERFPKTPTDQVAAAIRFLTLNPAGVRQLAGKDETELDVPVWEHFKRVHRYLIRPLVPLPDGELAWGAATAERARSIWLGTFSNGYLPADFAWPTVAQVVEAIKRDIERRLEVRAHEICTRHTAQALRGIDFRRRFPQEHFDDVGDFDVLAYWPNRNLWLAVECKYNQPPFCLKDARRLRDRVFGDERDRAQFGKIERRLQFLRVHCDRLRSLLGWPVPSGDGPPAIRAAYVSRDIYWFLLHPPYSVDTEFVRVDALDDWLGALLVPVLIATGDAETDL